MADEEKVVEKSSGGGLGALLPMITLGLVIVAIGISAVSLISVMGVNSSIQELIANEEKVELLPGEIPVTEIETFGFAENFIFSYEDKEDSDLTHTVVVDISIGMHNTEDTAEEVTEIKGQLTSKELIIRDGLESMMKSKSFDDFQTEESLGLLKADILAYLQGRLGTGVIIDIYFNNMLTTSR